jgi:hypothetical protein
MKREPFKIEYNPGPVTMSFLEDKTSRAILLSGCIGAGATVAALFKMIMLQSKWVEADENRIRKSRFLIVTQGEVARTLDMWFPPSEFGGGIDVENKTFKYEITDRQIEVVFCTPEEIDDRIELTGAIIDAAENVEPGVLVTLLGRLRFPSRNESGGKNPFTHTPQVVVITYPQTQEHWAYQKFIKEPLRGYSVYHLGVKENEHNLPDDYYDNLRLDLDAKAARRLVDGEWEPTE